MDEATPQIDRRYQIIKKLGYGMSGEVYLVKDHDGEKALKFLNQVQMNVSRDEALKNFKNEFSILKELNHPNIAQILDFGFDESTQKYYFTSELISGLDLYSACRGQRAEVIEKLFIQVLRALNYLHTRGIYHFDIKPGNILVKFDSKGAPEIAKLIDFGLAGFHGETKKAGTLAYMAPEVFRMDVMDARSDLYSLGVTFYKCLTDNNPFLCREKDLKVVKQKSYEKHMNVIPRDPSKVRAENPKYLDAIIGRMLKKDPIDRYPQTAMVLRDIGFLSGKKIAIETEDTKLSYLPEKGALIGREKEWNIFTNIFEEVFGSQEKQKTDLLLIQGKKGTGKTRFIEEIKYHSQLKNVPVLKLTEISNTDFLLKKFILSVDGEDFNDKKTLFFLKGLKECQCLIVWGAEFLRKDLSNYRTIHLKNFSEEEFKQYLCSVTGLDSESKEKKSLDEKEKTAGKNIAHEIYLRTEGNPFFVTEYFKALFNQNLLFDTHGRWEETMLEDIRIDFDRLKIPDNIRNILLNKYEILPASCQKILQFLGINQEALSVDELRELFSHSDLKSDLNFLLTEGILIKQEDDEKEKKEGFYFKNYLMPGLIREAMTVSEKNVCHDKLLKVFENKKGHQGKYLYHKGHGSNREEAIQALNELGDIYLKDYKFNDAIDQFSFLLEKLESHKKERRIDVLLKLSESLKGKHNFDESRERLKQALELMKDNKAIEEKYFFPIFDKLIDVSLKQDAIHESDKYLELAKKYCIIAENFFKRYPKTPFYYQLIIQNYLGFIDFIKGNFDQAIKIFLKTYKDWVEKLDSKDRKKVTNNRIVEAYGAKDNYELALKFCERNIKILENEDDSRALGLDYYLLGDVFYKKSQKTLLMKEREVFLNRSNFYLKKSKELAKKVDDRALLYRVYNAFGNTYFDMKKNDEALDCYDRALRICENIGEYEYAGSLAYNISNIYSDMKLKSDQESYLIYAIHIFEGLPSLTTNSNRALLWSYISLCRFYVDYGEERKIEARKYLNRAERLFRRNPYLKTDEYWLVSRQAVISKLWGDEKSYQKKLKRAEELKSDSNQKKDFEECLSLNLSNLSQNKMGFDEELIQFKKSLSGIQNFERLLEQTVLFFNKISVFEKAVFLRNLENQEFAVETIKNFTKEEGAPIYLNFVRKSQKSNSIEDLNMDGRDFLCIPIKVFGEDKGAFYLVLEKDKVSFEKEDFHRFKSIFEMKFLELHAEVSTHFL